MENMRGFMMPMNIGFIQPYFFKEKIMNQVLFNTAPDFFVVFIA